VGPQSSGKGQKPEKVAKRRELANAIKTATAPWLELTPEIDAALVASDHRLDALVSAIVGRALEMGQTLPIPDASREFAKSEGWIHLPLRKPLAACVGFASSA
jgi:hypothetical protein